REAVVPGSPVIRLLGASALKWGSTDGMRSKDRRNANDRTGIRITSRAKETTVKRSHWVAPLAVAALILLAGGADPASGAMATSAPAATPTATIDRPTQAYLTLLQTYYLPWVLAHHQQRDTCGPDFNALPATERAQQLPACRPILVTEIAAGKT